MNKIKNSRIQKGDWAFDPEFGNFGKVTYVRDEEFAFDCTLSYNGKTLGTFNSRNLIIFKRSKTMSVQKIGNYKIIERHDGSTHMWWEVTDISNEKVVCVLHSERSVNFVAEALKKQEDLLKEAFKAGERNAMSKFTRSWSPISFDEWLNSKNT